VIVAKARGWQTQCRVQIAPNAPDTRYAQNRCAAPLLGVGWSFEASGSPSLHNPLIRSVTTI
jgi:hypothetical protein